MKNLADLLLERIAEKQAPIVVGLDPAYERIPLCYTMPSTEKMPFEIIAEAIFRFNTDVIDAVCDLVPVVKPQLAFYEQYGSAGIIAFEKTIRYAKEKGLLVIADAKKNDIGNTAAAYAQAYLGKVEGHDGRLYPAFDVDFLTVSPFLGSESLKPFVDACIANNKGIFILARTSNSSSGEIQEAVHHTGETVSVAVGRYVADNAERFHGATGYSSIGAVVGATYPGEAEILRQVMPRSIFLVPGYGAQGGSAEDVTPCFNPDGFGAVVSSSRGVLYAYEKQFSRESCTRDACKASVRSAATAMKNAVYAALVKHCGELAY